MRLQEIPGAIERPAGCRIAVTQDADSTEIVIPSRQATWVDKIPPAIYAFSLLTFLYIGAIFFTTGRLTVVTDLNIDHGHISRTLHRYIYFLVPVWLGFEAIGWITMFLVLRPFFMTETLRIGREGVTVTRALPWSRRRETVLRENLRGFLLRRDPQGMWSSRLALQSVGAEIEVGEYAREVEREWLASVGNAVLGRM